MVMDMFYAYVEMKRKKRVHFHGFMLDVHRSKSVTPSSQWLFRVTTTKTFSFPVIKHVKAIKQSGFCLK